MIFIVQLFQIAICWAVHWAKNWVIRKKKQQQQQQRQQTNTKSKCVQYRNYCAEKCERASVWALISNNDTKHTSNTLELESKRHMWNTIIFNSCGISTHTVMSLACKTTQPLQTGYNTNSSNSQTPTTIAVIAVIAEAATTAEAPTTEAIFSINVRAAIYDNESGVAVKCVESYTYCIW